MTAKNTPSNEDPQLPESAVHNTITSSVSGHVVQTGMLTGDVHLHPVLRSTPVPRQLPPAPRMFAGRHDELAQLTAAVDGAGSAGATVVISAIAGAGGIGKTWLALHWAYQQLDRFPDGQLFVDLRGFTPTGEPMTPDTAIRGFLDAFGVGADHVPVELDAQVGLYRSLVADKQILIILDNVRDTAQIIPLLPGSPTCTVLATSRDRLAGLATAHDARLLALDVLNNRESRDVLVHRLGQRRLIAEPDAASELLAFCAGLPLALAIVAARATAHPGFSLAVLADELRDTTARLGALDDGDTVTSLTAVLSWSYIALSPEQAEVFGLLGLTSGPDISLPAAASLTGLTAARTRAVLRGLERMSLLQQHRPNRWRMHDLTRLYAAERAQYDLPANTLAAAPHRLIDFYRYTAHAADRLINPRRPPIDIGTPIPGCHPQPLSDQTAAWTWFDAERSCALASQALARHRGLHRAVWQLTWALDTFHYRRGHLHDRITAWQAGLTASQREGDSTAVFTAHRLLGHAYVRVGKHIEALEHLARALDIAKDRGDLLDQAHTHTFLVTAWGLYGDDRRAMQHATNAQRLFGDLGHPIWEAQALNSMGWFAARLGDHDQARIYCEEALTLCRRHNDAQGVTDSLNSLGYVAYLTGHFEEALCYYRQALSQYRESGHTYYQANSAEHLGKVYAAVGDFDRAHDSWQEALGLYRDQHRLKDVARVRQQLNELAGSQLERPSDPDQDR